MPLIKVYLEREIMTLKNKFCVITFSVNEHFSFGDPKNKQYDIVLNPKNYNAEDHIKSFEFDVNLFKERKKIALISFIGEPTGDIVVLEGTVLTILQDETFLQIDVIKGEIIDEKPTDIFGSVFSINKFGDDYIVHGEIEIARYNNDFNKVWSFSGKDIFASITGKNAFEMTKNSIKLYDFQDNYYEIDYDGKEIEL